MMLHAVAGKHLGMPVVHARRHANDDRALGHFGADALALADVENVGDPVVLLTGHHVGWGLHKLVKHVRFLRWISARRLVTHAARRRMLPARRLHPRRRVETQWLWPRCKSTAPSGNTAHLATPGARRAGCPDRNAVHPDSHTSQRHKYLVTHRPVAPSERARTVRRKSVRCRQARPRRARTSRYR